MILAGDIGGTKSHFGVFDHARLVAETRLENARYATFAAMIAALAADPALAGRQIGRACLAVAGPIDDSGRTARLTNLPWLIDAGDVTAALGIANVTLANDFAAAALGAITSAPDQRVTLQAGEPRADAPCLVVGAGTGLGMAIVLPDNGGWRVMPGEGGHVGFAPASEEHVALWRFLQARGGGTTWERLISGPGLATIHRFVAGTDADADPGDIGAQGLADPASTAGRALQLFVTLYGAYAGDMAMTCLPRGGVYLAGGIAGKILPAMTDGRFTAGFGNKSRHAGLLAKMPIHIATDPVLALRGAALLAAAN